mgnify:CR=1 FL=1
MFLYDILFIIIGIIITILILYKIYNLLYIYNNSIYVFSNIDNQYYLVRNTSNKQESADTLAIINKNINKLLNSLRVLQTKEDSNNKNIELLLARYNPKHLMENIELDNTSYTINKGATVAVCLATRDLQEQIYDINNLMFVLIHELSHIGCVSTNHNEEFKNFFIFLLRKSIDCGIYTYQDYTKKPIEYCGMIINSTPIHQSI